MSGDIRASALLMALVVDGGPFKTKMKQKLRELANVLLKALIVLWLIVTFPYQIYDFVRTIRVVYSAIDIGADNSRAPFE